MYSQCVEPFLLPLLLLCSMSGAQSLWLTWAGAAMVVAQTQDVNVASVLSLKST